MVKKFIQLLVLLSVFSTTSLAMVKLERDEYSGRTRVRTILLREEAFEEVVPRQTSTKEYFIFGFAFCMMGACSSSGASMLLGGFLCSKGLYRHVTDNFD